MIYGAIFAPYAPALFIKLYRYIAITAYALVAERYTKAIVAHRESLSSFPHAASAATTFDPACESRTIANVA